MLQRPTGNSGVTPIERGSIITYRKTFGFGTKTKIS